MSTSEMAARMRLQAVDVISDDDDEETAGFGSHATKETLTRAQYLEDDVFGLRNYSINAPPVEPFAPDAEVEAHQKLYEVFCPGSWRIDGGRERRSKYHEVVVDDVKKYGKSSLYAQARCPYSGVTALHACAINGFLGLLRALVEFGDCDPVDVAEHLAPYFDARIERARGADALWMAKRRGHKACVAYLMSLAAVQDSLGAAALDAKGREKLDREDEKQRRALFVKNARGLGRRVEDRRDRERVRSRELAEGCRVRVLATGDKATVRYVGPVDYTRGTMVGVELDHDRGRNSGVVKGKEYFECAPKRGLMVNPSEVQLDDVDYATMTPVDKLPRNPLPVLNYFHEKYDDAAEKRRLSRLSVRKSSFSGASLERRMVEGGAATLDKTDEARAQAAELERARFH